MSVARAYIAGLVLGLVVLGFIGALTIPPLAAHGDFAEQWGAARIALDGGDPYDTATWRTDIARVAGRASDAAAFVYPPYVTFALMPLALLPVGVASTLWILTSATLAAIALGALLRARAVRPIVAFGFGLALLGSGTALLAFAQGQWSYLLLAALCAAALGGRAASLVTLAKPAIAPLPLIGLLLERDRRFAYALGAAALVIALTLARWDWWSEWLREELDFASARPARTASLLALLQPLGIVGLIAVVAISVVALYVAIRARSLAVWFASGVLVAPYIQAYDHIVLLAPLAMCRGHARLVGLALVLLIAGELVVSWSGLDAMSALVAASVWLVVVAARD